VALVCNPSTRRAQELAAAREGASKLGLEVRYFPTNTAAALEAALANIARAATTRFSRLPTVSP